MWCGLNPPLLLCQIKGLVQPFLSAVALFIFRVAPLKKKGRLILEDISEGQTGFVAEVRVSHQFLEERLSDRLSGVNPQPLRSSVPGYHLAVDISSGLPVGQSKLKRRCSCCQRAVFFLLILPEILQGELLQRGGSDSIHGSHFLLVCLDDVFPLVGRQAEQILKDTSAPHVRFVHLVHPSLSCCRTLLTRSSLVGLLSVGRMKMASTGSAPVFCVRWFCPFIQPRCGENSSSLIRTMSSPFLKLRNVGSSVEEKPQRD